MKRGTGKRELGKEGYIMICKKLMTLAPTGHGGSWSTSVFAWCFSVFLWVLISRPESTETIALPSITWKGDALTVDEEGGKGDQTGSDSFGKHVYANPALPCVCPVLALSVLLFCSGGRDAESVNLFPGIHSTKTGPKNRFSEVLKELVKTLSTEELAGLGCDEKDIAPYSLRKGAATFADGQVAGPNPVTVQLRMGHSLGKVNDPYIHQSDPQDMLCGRTLSLLNMLDERFAALPPHFSKAGLEILTLEFWVKVCPNYSALPAEIKPALPFLMASLLYHESYLKAELKADHPIWNCRVFSANENLEVLRANILTGIATCPDTGLQATGLPPHVLQSISMNVMKDQIEELQSQLNSTLKDLVVSLPGSVSNCVVQDIRGYVCSIYVDVMLYKCGICVLCYVVYMCIDRLR
jgi:hypothetical protein